LLGLLNETYRKVGRDNGRSRTSFGAKESEEAPKPLLLSSRDRVYLADPFDGRKQRLTFEGGGKKLFRSSSHRSEYHICICTVSRNDDMTKLGHFEDLFNRQTP